MEVQFATLDAERLKKADVYIPLARKVAIVRVLAPGCIEKVDMRLEGDKAGVQPMPPRWQESQLGKRLVMSYILAGLYLHQIDVQGLYQEKPTFDFTARQYDIFSQLFSQLEAFKRDRDPESEVKSIAASILSDYRDFEKLLNAEIFNLLQAKNDTCTRMVEMFMAQTSPEAIQNATEALKQVQAEAEAEVKKRKEWIEKVRMEKGA